MSDKPYVEIKLSRGKVAFIDAEDLELVSKYPWHVVWNHKRRGRKWYARTSIYNVDTGKHKNVSLHRLLMNPEPGQHVDHISGDSLDCRRDNMRNTTRSGNGQNRRILINNKSSIYRGVSRRSRERFRASIEHNCIKYNLGYFKNEVDAAKAYDKKAVELFGKHALLNFPLITICYQVRDNQP